jgi:wyosine [tRNA(Phe)-imidazoG37] synthetase (radical SAM superfamily)
MSTFLFDDIIFGPVNSRRLGVSLGLNLVPVNRKVCTFNCIYCECGWTNNRHMPSDGFPQRELISESLTKKMAEMRNEGFLPDSITFAGNGEPTLHPDFPGIIEDTVEIRDQHARESQIVVLSNASLADRPGIREALTLADRNILKLDTGIEETFKLLNQPPSHLKLVDIIENLKLFPENLIIQTLFIRGTHGKNSINNTTEKELIRLLKLYGEISPAEVQVYTIARDTPVDSLQRIPLSELNAISERIEALGIKTSVFG